MAGIDLKVEQLKIKDFDPQYKPKSENLAPAILVSNHVSWFDVIFYCAYNCPSFLAKEEVANIPFYGTIATSIQSIFVTRD